LLKTTYGAARAQHIHQTKRAASDIVLHGGRPLSATERNLSVAQRRSPLTLMTPVHRHSISSATVFAHGAYQLARMGKRSRQAELCIENMFHCGM